MISSFAVPPAAIVLGSKRFAKPIASTLSLVRACVTFVRPSCVCNAPAGIVFVYLPCTFDVTLTEMVQLELGAIVALVNETELLPLTAVSAAEVPHPLNAGEAGSAMKTSGGRSSVNEA